ncbi:hypothetical protein U1Q18_014546 [Sarracenia purpurea var. burkii]
MDRDQGYDNVGKGSISEEGTKSDSEESVSEEDDQGVVDDPGAGDYDDEVDESEASLTKGEGAAREGSDVSVSWDRGKASEETEVARALLPSDGKLMGLKWSLRMWIQDSA